MSQLTSRGLDNTSSAFVSDINIRKLAKERFKSKFETILAKDNFLRILKMSRKLF